MKKVVLTAAVGFVTLAGYAQWSNPADDTPAYHTAPPAPGATLPPVIAACAAGVGEGSTRRPPSSPL